MPTTSPYLVLSLLDVLEGRCLFLTFALGLLPGSGSLPHSLPVFLGGWTHLCSAALENLECTWLYYSYCPVPMLQAQGLLWAPRPSAPCMVSGPGCQAQHNTVLMLLCKALLVSAGLQGLGGLTTCTRKAVYSEKFCLLQPLRLMSHCVAWVTRGHSVPSLGSS